jgi:hypothetical protein
MVICSSRTCRCVSVLNMGMYFPFINKSLKITNIRVGTARNSHSHKRLDLGAFAYYYLDKQ